MTKQCPSDEQEKPERPDPFLRPDESDRAARAKRWLEQARGKGQQPKE